MMTKPLMFLAFAALLGICVAAIVIAIWLGIESYCKNKRKEYPPQKGGKK